MGILKNLRHFLINSWQSIILWFLGTSVAAILLFYELGDLLPGFNRQEVITINHSSNLSNIINNPLNGMHALVQYALITFDKISPFAMRSVSAAFGLVVSGLFFYILRHWYTKRIAVLGTLLFTSSAWFLHTSRLATPLALQLSLVLAIAYGVWLKRTKTRTIAVLIGMCVGVWLIYIPGFIWFVLIASIWQRKSWRALMERTPVFGVMSSYFLAILLLLPLIRSIILSPNILRSIFGLPTSGFPSITTFFRNIISIPEQLFFQSPLEPSLWLGRLPLLDIFGIAMLGLGVYAFYSSRTLDRTKMFFGVFITGTILVGISGPVNIALFLPFIYIVISAGFALLLQQWFTIFPRNPLARSVGTSLITIAVLLSVFYSINHYFIAWPNAPATEQVFSYQI